jgi:hypothetical protein
VHGETQFHAALVFPISVAPVRTSAMKNPPPRLPFEHIRLQKGLAGAVIVTLAPEHITPTVQVRFQPGYHPCSLVKLTARQNRTPARDAAHCWKSVRAPPAQNQFAAFHTPAAPVCSISNSLHVQAEAVGSAQAQAKATVAIGTAEVHQLLRDRFFNMTWKAVHERCMWEMQHVRCTIRMPATVLVTKSTLSAG